MRDKDIPQTPGDRHPDEQATLEVSREVAKACGGTVREAEHWFVIEPPTDIEAAA